MKKSKKYKEIQKKIDAAKLYSLDDALKLSKELSYSKFDASLDVCIILNLKDKQKKETVKGTITFPHNVGGTTRIAVIAEESDQNKATKAGADFVGLDDLITKIEKGWTDFDILIATPKVMPQVAKLGKVIGQKGLMPNPKNETVTADVKKAVTSYKAGKISYKMNEDGTFQMKFGKTSLSDEQNKENFIALLSSIKINIKNLGDNIINKVIISPTMGPSINVDKNSFTDQLK